MGIQKNLVPNENESDFVHALYILAEQRHDEGKQDWGEDKRGAGRTAHGHKASSSSQGTLTFPLTQLLRTSCSVERFSRVIVNTSKYGTASGIAIRDDMGEMTGHARRILEAAVAYVEPP